MAAQLGDSMRLGKRVGRIAMTARGATVTCTDGTASHRALCRLGNPFHHAARCRDYRLGQSSGAAGDHHDALCQHRPACISRSKSRSGRKTACRRPSPPTGHRHVLGDRQPHWRGPPPGDDRAGRQGRGGDCQQGPPGSRGLPARRTLPPAPRRARAASGLRLTRTGSAIPCRRAAASVSPPATSMPMPAIW